MLEALKKLLKSDDPINDPSDEDLKLAAATLMFELIRSDGKIDDVELTCMNTILKREFNLDNHQVEILSKEAKESAYQATSLHGFTREICDSWGNQKRVKLLEYLWTLTLADDQIDPHERHMVRKVAGLLYLTERQITQARENAKQYLKNKQLKIDDTLN